MRKVTAALALSLLLGSASLAYAQAAPAGKAPAAEAGKPAPAPEPFAEPNMKLPKNSGGITNSPLIKDAPLPQDFVMGSATAPLTMIEYASLTCPHCAHFSSTVLPVLIKEYVDTGKMRYILRQFPLNEPALKAAMLLNCVGEQSSEKYYVFAKVLFDAQPKWAFDSNYMAGLETIATVGGLSKDQFLNCTVNTQRELETLKQKKLHADELKVPHTPYIFVGNEAYEGDRTPEAISKFIEKKLAEITAKKTAE
jgi:protein-disulfide isomerase